MSRLTALILIGGLLLLGGCNESSAPGGSSALVVEPQIAVAPQLRQRLPDTAIAYVRIPSFWGVASAPDGRALDPARLHPAHVNAIKQLRAAFSSEPAFARGPGVVGRLLLSHWAGPLELAVLAQGRVPGPGSTLLVQLPLSGFTKAADLGAAVSALGGPPLSFDDKGYAALPQAALHFDAGNGQLLALLGQGADPATLSALQGKLAPADPVFAASEARIDQSGQGLYAWVDLVALRGLISAGLQQSGDAAPVLTRILADCKALAFGFGSVGGRGRLSLEIDAPKAAFLRYFAREPRTFALNTVDLPEYVGSLSLLMSPAEFAEFRTALAADAGPAAEAELAKALAEMSKATQLQLDDLLAAFGPDVVGFADRAGEFLAVKVRDRSKLEALLNKLNALPQTRLARNGDVQMLELGSPVPASTDGNPLLDFLGRMRTRFYWLDETEYLVFSAVPQALKDRQKLGANAPLADWLLAAQGPGYGRSMLMLAGPTRNMARRGYYNYLGGLQTLADLAKVPMDPFLFASAAELRLPVEGAAGLALESSDQGLALSLNYDVTGFDLLGGQSTLATVAVAGIVAAVAVPAYSDYTQRAKVSAALSAAGAAKIQISEYALSNGRAPDTLEEAGSDAELGDAASLHWENNTLLIRFDQPGAPSGLRDSQLALGLKTDGSTWVCGYAEPAADAAEFLGNNPADLTTLSARYLPNSCR